MLPSASRQRTPNRNSSPSAGIEERVALHVEEEVARRRLRQQAEPALLLRLEQVDEDLVLAVAVELERRLVAQRLERVRREPADAEVGRATPRARSAS